MKKKLLHFVNRIVNLTSFLFQTVEVKRFKILNFIITEEIQMFKKAKKIFFISKKNGTYFLSI